MEIDRATDEQQIESVENEVGEHLSALSLCGDQENKDFLKPEKDPRRIARNVFQHDLNALMPTMWKVIKDLHPSNANSAVKLRVVRAYDFRSPTNKNEIYSHEVIFHDQEGVRISASIPSNLIATFKPKLKEGDISAVKNFLVVPNNKKIKTTSNKYCIKILNRSHVTPIVEEGFMRNMFIFKTFDEIGSMKNVYNNELFDVIGIIVKRGLPHTTICTGGIEKKLINIVLEDLEHRRLQCTFWEDYVDEIMNYFESRNQKCNIMIIQMARANIYKGYTEICNAFNISKILFNDDVPEINALRARVMDDSSYSTTISTISLGSTLSDNEELSTGHSVVVGIEQLCNDKKDAFYWICGTIIAVENKGRWFYLSCNKCQKGVTKVEHKFFCNRCNRYDDTAKMRYRLKVYVVDETGNATFLMWDRECLQLVGVPAEEIKCESDEVIPVEIERALVDQQFIFKVQMKQGEWNKYVFTVTKVSRNRSIISAFGKECFDNQGSNCTTKSSDSKIIDGATSATTESYLMTPLQEESSVDVSNNWLNYKSLKRSLTDQFSSTIPAKKAKVFIKQEKKE